MKSRREVPSFKSSSGGSIEISKPDATDHRIFNLKVARQDQGKAIILTSGDETITVHTQEDNDQKVFDLRVNLLKTGVTSKDKSVTIKVLPNEDGGHDYDLSVPEHYNSFLYSPDRSIEVARGSNNPEDVGYNH